MTTTTLPLSLAAYPYPPKMGLFIFSKVATKFALVLQKFGNRIKRLAGRIEDFWRW